MEMIVKEFAAAEGISPVEANSVLGWLTHRGIVKHVGNRKTSASGKGKPSRVYDVPTEAITLTLKTEIPATPAIPDQSVEEPAPETETAPEAETAPAEAEVQG